LSAGAGENCVRSCSDKVNKVEEKIVTFDRCQEKKVKSVPSLRNTGERGKTCR